MTRLVTASPTEQICWLAIYRYTLLVISVSVSVSFFIADSGYQLLPLVTLHAHATGKKPISVQVLRACRTCVDSLWVWLSSTDFQLCLDRYIWAGNCHCAPESFWSGRKPNTNDYGQLLARYMCTSDPTIHAHAHYVHAGRAPRPLTEKEDRWDSSASSVLLYYYFKFNNLLQWVND